MYTVFTSFPLAYILYPLILASAPLIEFHDACACVYTGLERVTCDSCDTVVSLVSSPSTLTVTSPSNVLFCPVTLIPLALSPFSLTYTLNVYSVPDDNLPIVTSVASIPSLISTLLPSIYVSTP